MMWKAARPGGPRRFALILGAMKSGTTVLYRYLEKHPQLCGCIEKEPSYFAPAEYDWDLSAYQRLWPRWRSGHARALEGSTDYAKWPSFAEACDRLGHAAARCDLDFKFLYLVRDPITLVESFYRHAMTDDRWAGRLSLTM